ncbi:MAG: radical SAM protein [Chloroflexi bacterium]|jgi:uncharacterized protein|nr:radical SAM protein [Chloroflexota bacterium]
MKYIIYDSSMLKYQLANHESGQCDCDCDCACAVTPCADFTTADFTGTWRAVDAQIIPFSDGWQGMFTPGGFVPLAVLNPSAYDLWTRFQQTQNIDLLNLSEEETQAALEMASAGLLVPQTEQSSTFNLQPSAFLSAWLHLTDRCNLRCAYCYLPHVREDMTAETGRAAVDATFRSALAHGYETVKLKYAGGEPLLRFPLILELHQYAQQLAEEYNLELDGVVLSNGTLLTEAIITNLQSHNLRLMISLDGMGDWHDTQRPYAGGRGTFQDVAEAVELALDHALVPHISITVSGRNAEGLPAIIAWVLERDLPFSVNFYRQNDLSVTHTDLKLEEEKIIAGMLAAFDVIEDTLPEHSLLASLTDRANLAVPHERTCSVGHDYLVFDQNGRVAKCQMMMNEAVADVHTEDPLQRIRTDQLGVQNISVEEKAGCRDCDWKFWCAGGCPLETFRATGRYDVQSPNCNIYKAIFPEVLRLEGLRLLKQAGELA